MNKYHWACQFCGSQNVTCTADVRWDYDKQEWVIDSDPHDNDYCNDCEDESTLVQVYAEET